MAIKRQSSPFEVFKRHCDANRSKQPVVDDTTTQCGRWKQPLVRDAVAAWSDLPDGILELITDKMSSITDLTRFRFVCKNWNLFHKIKPLLPQHPWLLCYDNKDNSYQLFEPFSDVIICRSDFSFKDFHVCASKNGWLLLCHNRSPAQAIAYSPFTANIITLPPMKFKLASFSTCPSDPDCVFFALNENPLMGRTTIGIWKQNEPNWRAIEFTGGIHLMKSIVFSSGSFYCSDHYGLLGVFSIQDQSWRIVEETNCSFLSHVTKPCESHLVEFNGRIFFDFSGVSQRWIFELNLCKKEWITKDGLKEVAIFVVDGSVAIATAASVTKSIDRVYYIKGRSDEQGCKKLWIEPPSY